MTHSSPTCRFAPRKGSPAYEDEYLQIKKRGSHSRWTLQYTRDVESTNHPFFEVLKQIEISNVLHFVNQGCQFVEAFEHVLGRYAKQARDDRILIACIIAWGTNILDSRPLITR